MKQPIMELGTIAKGVKTEDITPKNDYHLFCPPHCNLKLEAGKKCKVPVMLISSLESSDVLELKAKTFKDSKTDNKE